MNREEAQSYKRESMVSCLYQWQIDRESPSTMLGEACNALAKKQDEKKGAEVFGSVEKYRDWLYDYRRCLHNVMMAKAKLEAVIKIATDKLQ